VSRVWNGVPKEKRSGGSDVGSVKGRRPTVSLPCDFSSRLLVGGGDGDPRGGRLDSAERGGRGLNEERCKRACDFLGAFPEKGAENSVTLGFLKRKERPDGKVPNFSINEEQTYFSGRVIAKGALNEREQEKKADP